MCQFIESIRVIDGEVKLLHYHQQRVERTLKACGGDGKMLNLEAVLEGMTFGKGVYKARIVYDAHGVVKDRSAALYRMRIIERLKLITDSEITYEMKSVDRSRLEALAAQKGEADEIVIVKEGRITDTSYSNVALYDGKKWDTPARPLLRGTMRQHLIDEGQIVEAEIGVEDLDRYEKIALINAMMPLGRCVVEMKDMER